MPGSNPPLGAPSDVPPEMSVPERCNTLMLSFVVFFLICFAVWVVSATKRYREEYAQVTEGWRVGTSRMIEITLVEDDKYGLACASDQVFWGLQCAGNRDLRGTGPEPHILQPYNTTSSQLFLGAGLWSSPDLKEPLPRGRFTVVCNYQIKGVARSPAIRFGQRGAFSPLRKTVTVGTLTECMIPR